MLSCSLRRRYSRAVMERTMTDPTGYSDNIFHRDALIYDDYTMVDDGVIQVDQAERALVEGSFRKALTLSNQYLKQQRGAAATTNFKMQHSLDNINNNTSTVDNVYLNLTTNVYFPQFEQDDVGRKVIIDLRRTNSENSNRSLLDDSLAKTHSSCLDRMGAVALQSWFELWKKQQQQQQSQTPAQTLQGFRHLEPFLNVFTVLDYNNKNMKSKSKNNNNSAMSLSLAVIFVQFSFAIGNIDNSIEMASELLHHLLILSEQSTSNRLSIRQQQQQQQQQEEACHILMDTLFTRWLPTVVIANYDDDGGNNKSTVLDNLWLRLTSRTGDEKKKNFIPWDQPQSEYYIIAKKPQHKSIRSILYFLETTFPGRFPIAHSRYANYIEDYRRSLIKLLDKARERDEWEDHATTRGLETIKQQPQQQQLKSSQLVPNFTTTSDKIKTTVQKLLVYWKNIIHQQILSPLLGKGQSEERIRVVMALFTAWIAWRNRRKLITSIQKGSTIVLLQPLQEIVQALVGA